jgi:mRNA-degrading endonuclease toxin of MazEF toxin-antitoxin module
MPPAFTRGEVILTRFPFTDLSGSAVRPALVVSHGAIGQDLVLIGISSVVRGTVAGNDVAVPTTHPEFASTGLRVTSVIRVHKLAAVEQAVVVRRLGKVGPMLQAEVDRLLRTVLGL